MCRGIGRCILWIPEVASACLILFPAKGHKIKKHVNRRSCLLLHSSFLRISSTDLSHRGKIYKSLFKPFSMYRDWRSEDALFLAVYDSDNWDILKVLSERTLQNMTKLTWERKLVKSDFLGEKKHFPNFLGYILLALIYGYTLYTATGIKIPICRTEHKHLKRVLVCLKKSNSRTQVSNIWNEHMHWLKHISEPDNCIFSVFKFSSDVGC